MFSAMMKVGYFGRDLPNDPGDVISPGWRRGFDIAMPM
jgi:hypothetical protein